MTHAHTDLDPPGAQKLRHDLADTLTTAGALRSPRWRDAFAEVPRHLFVPQFRTRTPAGDYQYLDGTDPAQREAWLTAVYSDDSLITQWDASGTATSSSSQPAIMARMLEALDVHDGHRVLEVGTGTGYNAALLCHALGDGLVTSVDIDRALVDHARERLAACGYHPTLAPADGLAGWPDGALYDRIIGTCATHRIPTTWLSQIRPGGVIVTCVGRGVVRLVVGEDGSALGRFIPPGAFMPARPAGANPNLPRSNQADLIDGDGHVRPTGLFTDIYDHEFGFVADAATPNLSRLWSTDWYAVIDDTTRSWARANTGTHGTTVTQSGPRHLRDEIEEAHTWWTQSGRPPHHRLGLTVTAGGLHTLWVDVPGQQDYILV